jgi:hypothetical protein
MIRVDTGERAEVPGGEMGMGAEIGTRRRGRQDRNKREKNN